MIGIVSLTNNQWVWSVYFQKDKNLYNYEYLVQVEEWEKKDK